MKNYLRSLSIALVLCGLPGLVRGAGVVTEPTEANLRAALAGGGTVTFACDGVIPLASTLVITNDTALDASGRSITLSGNNALRVLVVGTLVNFDLVGVTVANGQGNPGGGLLSYGRSRVINCVFANNNASGDANWYPGMGGGIYNADRLVALGSTFVLNRAIGASLTEGSGYGGAIANAWLLLATNCTFYRNEARGSNAGFGGAVYTYSGFRLTNAIVNCTFLENRAKNGPGALFINLPPTFVQNTIFARNGTLSVSGSPGVPGDHNISSDGSAAALGPGNLINTEAMLGPFGFYGGPTWTMPLLAGSPAIDAGDNTAAPTTDQRGRARPYGAGCDIGAFESCPPYSIRGVVSGPARREEISIAVGSNLLPTLNGGNFSLLGVDSGTYSVTPQGTDFLFWPPSRSVTVGPDQANVNFKTYHWDTLNVDDLTNDTAHLVFAGTNDVVRRLLTSTNLVHWQSVQTNTIGPEKYWESWLPTSGQRMQFYRTVSP